MKEKVLVIHGFNSAPGKKAEDLITALPSHEIISPELPADPRAALEQLSEIVKNEETLHIVGTSLGGFYSLVLAEMMKDKEDIYIYAINPSYKPSKFFSSLENKVYRNYKTGKKFEAEDSTIKGIVGFLEEEERKVDKIIGLSNITYFIGNEDEVIDHSELTRKLSSLQVPYRLVESDQDHRHADLSEVVNVIKRNSVLVI
jgi:predicted esterase YcpF (UPF0227 family)